MEANKLAYTHCSDLTPWLLYATDSSYQVHGNSFVYIRSSFGSVTLACLATFEMQFGARTLKNWPHLYPNSPLNGFLGFGNDPWHHRPTQQHLGRENKTFLHNHRDRSIHIERECCCGPALADIWQLLRYLDKVLAWIYIVSQLPLYINFEW